MESMTLPYAVTNACTVSGIFLMKSGVKPTWSVMIVGYCLDDTRTWPFGFFLVRSSHGCQVTATGTLPAAKAAPASPEVRSTCFTSLSDRWLTESTYARNHWLVDPALTATFWALSCLTLEML